MKAKLLSSDCIAAGMEAFVEPEVDGAPAWRVPRARSYAQVLKTGNQAVDR